MNTKELHRIGSKIRAQGSTRGDLLTYIDGTLPLLTKAPQSSENCPTCAARRKAKAAAQKKWRATREKT